MSDEKPDQPAANNGRAPRREPSPPPSWSAPGSLNLDKAFPDPEEGTEQREPPPVRHGSDPAARAWPRRRRGPGRRCSEPGSRSRRRPAGRRAPRTGRAAEGRSAGRPAAGRDPWCTARPVARPSGFASAGGRWQSSRRPAPTGDRSGQDRALGFEIERENDLSGLSQSRRGHSEPSHRRVGHSRGRPGVDSASRRSEIPDGHGVQVPRSDADR